MLAGSAWGAVDGVAIPARLVCRNTAQAQIGYASAAPMFRVARVGLKEGASVIEGLRAEPGAVAKMRDDLSGRMFDVTVLTQRKGQDGAPILTLLARAESNTRLLTLDLRARTLYTEEPSGITGGAYRALHTAATCAPQ